MNWKYSASSMGWRQSIPKLASDRTSRVGNIWTSDKLDSPERSFYTRYLILKLGLRIKMEEKWNNPDNIAGEGFYPVWFY